MNSTELAALRQRITELEETCAVQVNMKVQWSEEAKTLRAEVAEKRLTCIDLHQALHSTCIERDKALAEVARLKGALEDASLQQAIGRAITYLKHLKLTGYSDAICEDLEIAFTGWRQRIPAALVPAVGPEQKGEPEQDSSSPEPEPPLRKLLPGEDIDGAIMMDDPNKRGAVVLMTRKPLPEPASGQSPVAQDMPDEVWEKAPEWAMWLSKSCAGIWAFTDKEPYPGGCCWEFPLTGDLTKFLTADITADVHWRDSLRKRPERREG